MALAAAGFWPALLLGPGDVAWFVLVCMLTGVPLGCELTLTPSMQTGDVNRDTLDTGRHPAGLFFAAWAVATKIHLALGVGIAFPALDLAGVAREAATQAPAAFQAHRS